MAESPAERLRQLADTMKDGVLDTENVLHFPDEELLDIAEAIETSQPPAIVTTLCMAKGNRRDDPCDRPAKHQGEHSWRAARLLRRMGEYEEKARQLPRVSRKLAAAEGALKQRTRELAEEQSRRRFRRRKPDRG